MKCKHNHECEQCIREEVAVLEEKLRSLRNKLPQTHSIKEYINLHPTQQYYHQTTPFWTQTNAQAGAGLVTSYDNALYKVTS